MDMNWLLLLRGLQLVFSVVILGLSAYIINWYDTETRVRSPTQVNFLVAAPVLSMLSIAYSEVSSRFVPAIHHPYAVLALDVCNSILYFSGFIALGVFLGGLYFCHGSVCASARADTVFAAFSWWAWTASATLGCVRFLQTRRTQAQAQREKTRETAAQA